jgi:hypothetical protein
MSIIIFSKHYVMGRKLLKSWLVMVWHLQLWPCLWLVVTSDESSSTMQSFNHLFSYYYIFNHEFSHKMAFLEYYLFDFILSCWNFPNQIASYNVIDIFENLTMNRGALTWVENFWNYIAKVIDYWSIFWININNVINFKIIQIQRCICCC